jgi:hypothetical protein
MDEQVRSIFDSTTAIRSARERLAAIVRAGLLAQVYVNQDEALVEEVFTSPLERVPVLGIG